MLLVTFVLLVLGPALLIVRVMLRREMNWSFAYDDAGRVTAID